MERYTQQKEVWERHSIYKVPTYLSDMNQNAYKPQVVSFGPYHCEDQQCKPMHEHKVRARSKFLNRSCKSLEPYKDALCVVIDQLMESYDNLDEKWQNDKNSFMDLMILDGTFMLEMLNSATDKYNDYHPNDPIFGSHGKHFNFPFIRRDMLLIENQIPMLVLETLIAVRDSTLLEQGKKTEDAEISDLQMYDCKQSHTPSVVVDITIIKTPRSVGENQELKRLVLEFFYQMKVDVVPEKPSLHLLDLYRTSMLSAGISSSENSKLPTGERIPEIIRSATELSDAGVGFRLLKKNEYIDFDNNNGVLRLPPLVVDDHTESSYLNLMAFERLHVGAGNQISSYICFMDNLIDSALDVAILQKKEIIQNATGSDKAVTSLFNQLSKEVPLDSGSSLNIVQKEVNNYSKRKLNHWRASLLTKYFYSPWALISLLAATVLLLLTITLTIYTILGFHMRKLNPVEAVSDFQDWSAIHIFRGVIFALIGFCFLFV